MKDVFFRERAEMILHNLALERTGAWRQFWRRWEISDEPLRWDAARLLREAGVHRLQPDNTQLVDAPEKENKMSIDKVDIALHIGVGAAAILVIGTGVWWFTESPLGFFGAALVNSFAWPIREMSQRKGHDPWPLQKHLEAWPSPVIGWLVAFGAEALITFGGSLIA